MDRFDELAKAAAKGGGPTRRDLIRRAGILGGATVASSALVQSVTAPAHAASVTCTSPTDQSRGCGPTCAAAPVCPVGTQCVAPIECETGICTLGTCRVATAQPCQGSTVEERDASCASGFCHHGGTCEATYKGQGMGASCHAQPPANTAEMCDADQFLTCSSTTNGKCVGLPGAICSDNAQCVSGTCRKLLPTNSGNCA